MRRRNKGRKSGRRREREGGGVIGVGWCWLATADRPLSLPPSLAPPPPFAHSTVTGVLVDRAIEVCVCCAAASQPAGWSSKRRLCGRDDEKKRKEREEWEENKGRERDRNEEKRMEDGRGRERRCEKRAKKRREGMREDGR